MDVRWSESNAFDEAKWEPKLKKLLDNGWVLYGDEGGRLKFGVMKKICFEKDLQREAFDRMLYAVTRLCHHDPEKFLSGKEFEIQYTTHVPNGLSPKDIILATITDVLVTFITSLTPVEGKGEPIVAEEILDLIMIQFGALGDTHETGLFQPRLNRAMKDAEKRRADGGSRM